MQRTLCAVTLISMVLATQLGCGPVPCPEPSSTGQCALTGLHKSGTQPTPLKLGTCSRLPLELCGSIPELRCVSYRAPDGWYGYMSMQISSDAVWQQLNSGWAGAESCVADAPADWSGTTLVLADIWATGSTKAEASFELLSGSTGAPHLNFQLDFSSSSDCNCLATDVVGLVVSSTERPTVCMNAVPSCY
jgi:hypothetical protein